jgi:hypothetical protein
MNLKQIKYALLFGLALFAAMPAAAQGEYYPFEQFSVGLKASTFGYGLEVATPLSNHFIARAGVNFTAGASANDLDFALPDDDDELYNAFGYVPEYRSNMKIGFTNGNLLVDYHPCGIFHLTAGVFVGQSKISANGKLVDWRNGYTDAKLKDGYTWPSLVLGDQKLDLTNGRLDLDLIMGNVVKPYFGLGVGRSIAKYNRVSFKFELGVIYQGKNTVKQNGKVLDLSTSDDEDVQDIHKLLDALTIYPMMNFQLSYRIF